MRYRIAENSQIARFAPKEIIGADIEINYQGYRH